MKTKSILWACLTCLSFFAFAACTGNADDLDSILLKANADLPKEENGITAQPLYVAGDYVVMEFTVSDEAPQKAHLLSSDEFCNEFNQQFEMILQQVQSDPDINAAVIEEIQNSVSSMMMTSEGSTWTVSVFDLEQVIYE